MIDCVNCPVNVKDLNEVINCKLIVMSKLYKLVHCLTTTLNAEYISRDIFKRLSDRIAPKYSIILGTEEFS